MSLLTSSCLY